MSRERRRGALLFELLVTLTIVGILLTTSTVVLARRRAVERDRVDRAAALRALSSEWTLLRSARPEELVPREKGSFVGPPDFVTSLAHRHPALTIRKADPAGIVFVRLEIDAGRRFRHRLVQEGFVSLGDRP